MTVHSSCLHHLNNLIIPIIILENNIRKAMDFDTKFLKTAAERPELSYTTGKDTVFGCYK